MLRPEQDLVHITRFGVGGSRTEEGVKHHLTRLGLLGTTVVDTMRVTGVARTALDIGREHGFQHGVVACDAAMQLGVDDGGPRVRAGADDVLAGRHPRQSRGGSGRSGSRVPRGDAHPPPASRARPRDRPRRSFRCRCAAGSSGPTCASVATSSSSTASASSCGERSGVSPTARSRRSSGTRSVARTPSARKVSECHVSPGPSCSGQRESRRRKRLRSEYELTRQRLGDQLPAHLAGFAEVHKRQQALTPSTREVTQHQL